MNETSILQKAIDHALSGKGAHAERTNVFRGMDWQLAGVLPTGAPHTIFQLLNHILYWEEWVLKWLDGENPPLPGHASVSWPGSPAPVGSGEWNSRVKRLASALKKLQKQARSADFFASGGQKTKLEMLQGIASHNSYHFGQVVVLRQMMGVWPPPGGGLTW